MLRCFTAVNHLSQLDHNEADLNQFLFSYFLFTSWLHSQACQFIFFFSTVDAKKKKSSHLHATNRVRQLATSWFNCRFYTVGRCSRKRSMFQKFLRNSQNSRFFFKKYIFNQNGLGILYICIQPVYCLLYQRF